MFSSKTSILKKVLIPVLLVTIVQTVLLYGTILFGGATTQLEDNYFDIFGEKVSNRRNDLENEMIQRWSSMGTTAEAVLQDVEQVLASTGATLDTLQGGGEVTEQFLTKAADDIIYLLRRNSVTGAFLILNNGSDKKPGLYFRDPDPNSNPGDYSDLQALRAPSTITKGLKIAMDSLWQPTFSFVNDSESDSAYFYYPLGAAQDHPEIDGSDLGYWSGPFHVDSSSPIDSTEIVSYSRPLVREDGSIIGVLGIELTVDYLAKQLPHNELNAGNKSGYLLAVGNYGEKDESKTFHTAVASGPFLSRMVADSRSLILQSEGKHSNYYTTLSATDGSTVYCCVYPLQLYNTHTPFESDRWALIGVVESSALLTYSNQFKFLLSSSWAAALLVGVLVVVFVAQRIARPIGTLADQLRETDPTKPIYLNKLGIVEIDELSDAIQHLSRQVADSSQKLSRILEMTDISIGAFEYDRTMPRRIFCTNQLYRLLGIQEGDFKDGYLDIPSFRSAFTSLRRTKDDTEEQDTILYQKLLADGGCRWLRLKLTQERERCLGVLIDVTREIEEKRKLEHDRDYDLLTNLYNRRAFHNTMEALFQHPASLKTAAMIMLDLDNLKFINDTYGHDYGDEYIRSAAGALKKYAGDQAIVSRLSGDEFTIFLYGYDSREGIRQICSNIQRGLQETMIYLPDLTSVIIRASAGISWYPDDADNMEDLVRFADFAMYLVKHTDKGRFTEFSIESYNREAYLLHCREELNTIIEKSLVAYHFQPILDARTGDVFAFEALMRPQGDNIKSPVELISLARSQSKLPQIERITFFCSMESFLTQEIARSDCKIFVNSISNQLLSPADITLFEKAYGEWLNRIVIELTEEERSETDMIRKKQALIEKWGAELALDDFGVGYNGEAILVDLTPHYIKIDMSIVRGIHKDPNRRQVLENLISYARERDIRIIAEGVEEREELEVLIQSGVDYLQGYYLGKPMERPAVQLPFARKEILSVWEQLQEE